MFTVLSCHTVILFLQNDLIKPVKGSGSQNLNRKQLDDDQRVPGTPLEADTPAESEPAKPSKLLY